MRVGIAGNGLLGRVLGLRLLDLGHEVTVFDDRRGTGRCAGEVAAGMLSPLAELETGDARIHALGLRSLDLWSGIIDRLGTPVEFARRGSLVTSHPRDRALAERLIARIERRLRDVGVGASAVRELDAVAARELEPGLAAGGGAWLLEGEGQVDAQAFMAAAAERLARAAEIVPGCPVAGLAPGVLRLAGGGVRRFDWVFDCRGLGARDDTMPLRGVRGEILWLETAEVSLRRPVRVMHPRYRVYIVPRPGHLYAVGATEIESEDLSPVSVRSLMELASATAVVDPAFLEARVVRCDVQLRPALPDNLPRLDTGDGLSRINGLFRHGYLLAPALVEDALSQALIMRSVA